MTINTLATSAYCILWTRLRDSTSESNCAFLHQSFYTEVSATTIKYIVTCSIVLLKQKLHIKRNLLASFHLAYVSVS